MAWNQRDDLGSATVGLAVGPIDLSGSAQNLSDLIGAIYDCALDPAHWPTTLERIGQQFSFASSALGVLPLRTGVLTLNVGVGMDPEWIEAGARYRADSVALWGGEERLFHYPLDEPILGSRTAGYTDRHANPYFVDILKPRGVMDAVLLTLAREPSLIGYVGFNRDHSAGAIGDLEVSALRLLGPHFRRAVTISNLFDLKAIEASTFASTLDVFRFALVLVDEHLGIVHANAVARAMLDARDPIRADKAGLALPSRVAHAALERAVLQAAADEAAMGSRGIGIPARRAEGEPYVIHVLPLRRSGPRRHLGRRAVAALFIASTELSPKMPAEAVALLYDLTPAETRVFELITSGMTLTGAGERLGVARSTVKTHLLRLYEKTGCKRQPDLMRLAAGLTSPA